MKRDHQHAQDSWPGYPKVRCTSIGPDVCLRPVGLYGEPDDAPPAGYFVSHERPEGGDRCEGHVSVRHPAGDGRATWTQTGTLEGGDLTLTPSILCRGSKDFEFHGFVRDGKWVPA